MDDLTPEQLDRIRSQESPWNDPLARRELGALREHEFLRQQQELNEKINGTWAGRTTFENRVAGAADAGEQRWMGPYKDTGIQQVEVAQIRNIPAPGTLAFEKTSQAEMIEGFRKLEEIERQPAAERLHFCTQQDSAKQLAGRDGYQHIYGCFYGNDSSSCIKLIQVGDGYEVESGRHRAYVAREIGAKTIPARVWVPDRSQS